VGVEAQRVLNAFHSRQAAPVVTSRIEETVSLENLLKWELKKENVWVTALKYVREGDAEVHRIKCACQQKLSDLHRNHSQELVEFGEQFVSACQFESERSVPEAIALKKRAQIIAQNGDYDYAELLLQESNQIQKREIEMKKEQVRQLFEAKRIKILNRQIAEIDLCLEKEASELQLNQLEFTKKIAVLQKLLVNTAAQLGITGEALGVLDEFQLRKGNKDRETPGSSRAPSRTPSRLSRSSLGRRRSRGIEDILG
jgi:hypothetical protein